MNTSIKGKSDRGQSSVGLVFAISITLLTFIGVVSIGYAFIQTPAIDATDTTSEAQIVGMDLVNAELSTDPSKTTDSIKQLDEGKTSDFFNGDPAYDSTVKDHPIITQNELNVTVTLEKSVNRDATVSNTVLFNGNKEISRHTYTAPQHASTYRSEVIVGGQMATLKIHTWNE